MTAKQLLRELLQEKYDVKDLTVTVDLGNGEIVTVEDVELDEDQNEVRLIVEQS